MNDSLKPMARHNGLVIQELPDEVLIYDINSNDAHCLNASCAFVWKHCDGQRSIREIVEAFASAGKGKVNEDFVWLAIDQLCESRLLVENPRFRSSGRSRRQMLKKIGLASVVAVPVIATLVAPQKAMASVTCVCVTNADCRVSGCQATPTCGPSGMCRP